MHDEPGTITLLLRDVEAGVPGAESKVMGLVYDELRRLAVQKLRHTRPGSTLTPTSLVHEAYLRVRGPNELPLQNRRHLFFAFARAMWRIVVEHSRKKKLGHQDDAMAAVELPGTNVDDLLDLDDALQGLAQEYPEEFETAMLRKALGFSIPEAASALGASEVMVKRRWAFAKAYLSRRILSGNRSDETTRTASRGF